MANLGPDFYKRLIEITNEVGMKPEDLLVVMSIESGLDPTAYNKGGQAAGLVQFIPKTLKGYGFKGSSQDFRNLEAIKQLEYVRKLIIGNTKYNGGPFKSAAQYYVSNFIPAAVKIPGIKREDPNTIIVAKNPTEPHCPHVSLEQEKLFYNSNSGLDFDKDGAITYGDIQKVVNREYSKKSFKRALEDMKNASGNQTSEDFKEDLFNKYKMKGDVYSKLNKSPAQNINEVLDNYIKMIAASEKHNKKLYNKLPTNQIIIKIKTANYIDSIEFARILSATLDEELLSRSYTYSNGYDVEVGCSIYGPNEECLNVVNQISESVSDAFKLATKKIGGIIVKTACFNDKILTCPQISIESADSNYRKFLLKFI